MSKKNMSKSIDFKNGVRGKHSSEKLQIVGASEFGQDTGQSDKEDASEKDLKSKDEQWQEFENDVRQKTLERLNSVVDNYLRTIKKIFFQSDQINKRRKILPTFPVRMVVFHSETLEPIFDLEMGSRLGTPEELSELLYNQMGAKIKELLSANTSESRNCQHKLYAECRNKYKMSPRDIYPLIDPDYHYKNPRDKRKFRNRLQKHYDRYFPAKGRKKDNSITP